MLDTYREMEQRGCRVTVEDGRVRVEEPNGLTWLYYSNGVREGYRKVTPLVVAHNVATGEEKRTFLKPFLALFRREHA
jgi:hypothetical protein